MKDLTNTKVQVTIDQATPVGQYRTALYIPILEYLAMDDTDLANRVQEQVNEWVTFVQNIKPPEESPPEETPIEESNGNPDDI